MGGRQSLLRGRESADGRYCHAGGQHRTFSGQLGDPSDHNSD